MQRSHELEAVFKRTMEALVASDAGATANLISSSTHVRLMLTDDDEWVQGHDEIAGLLVARAREAGMLSHDFEHVEGFEHGSVGWVAALVASERPSLEPLRLRHTVVYVLEAGSWRAVQWHVSRGTPNVEVFGHAMPKSIDGLVSDFEDTRRVVSDSFPEGTVTVMFTDIEDSTALSEAWGDDAWTRKIADHFDTVRSAVASHGGLVVKTLGDGTMTVFGSARSAIEAAAEIQRAMRDSDLKVRIGMHTGDSLRREGDYYGTAVNKAARVAAVAEGAEVLVSSVTAELAGGHGVEYGAPRTVGLKGLDGTHVILPVAWEA